MLHVGIDPGLHGAIAFLFDNRSPLIFDTPTLLVQHTTSRKHEYLLPQMVALLSDALTASVQVHVTLEAVHAMPGQGVTSMFNFGRGLGLWEGMLVALRIPYDKVAPQTWKKVMLADGGKDKGSAQMKALSLFPELADQLARKKDDGRAEAVLLALYGKQRWTRR